MSYVVLARKWRPQTFEDVMGQEHVVQTLHNAIASDRVAHAFLFTGARGVGKTTAARLLAKALCCEKGPAAEPCNTCSACVEITGGNSVDVLEIDGASNTGVDDVRELRESARYLPQRLRLKIFIIDEVHMLSVNAFNALLKLLEEPPAHLKFIFATTEPHKIPITILSRCQRYDFKRIPPKVMAAHLERICAEEHLTVEQGALEVICRAAEGGMRDALSLMDQVLSFVGQGAPITAQACVDALGIIDRRTVVDLTESILHRQGERALALVREASSRGFDLKELGGELLTELRHLTVAQVVKEPGPVIDLPAHEVEAVKVRARLVSSEELHRLFSTLMTRLDGLSKSGEPLLTMEMAVLALCLSPPAQNLQTVADLVARLEAAAGGAPLPPATPVPQGGGHVPAASPPTPTAAVAAPPVVAAPVVVAAPPGVAAPVVVAAPAVVAAPVVVAPAPTPPPAPVAPSPPAEPAPVTSQAGVNGMAVMAVSGADPRFVAILETLKDQRPALVSFLDVARARLEGNHLTLWFQQQFYLDALRQPENDKALREALHKVLGEGHVLTVKGPESQEEGGGDSLAQMREKERERLDAERLVRVQQHPAVKLAGDIFGAKIREVKAPDA